MAAPLVGITAVNALLFTVYGSIKTWQVERLHLALHPSQLSIGAIAVAGAGAGNEPPLVVLDSVMYLRC